MLLVLGRVVVVWRTCPARACVLVLARKCLVFHCKMLHCCTWARKTMSVLNGSGVPHAAVAEMVQFRTPLREAPFAPGHGKTLSVLNG